MVNVVGKFICRSVRDKRTQFPRQMNLPTTVADDFFTNYGIYSTVHPNYITIYG